MNLDPMCVPAWLWFVIALSYPAVIGVAFGLGHVRGHFRGYAAGYRRGYDHTKADLKTTLDQKAEAWGSRSEVARDL